MQLREEEDGADTWFKDSGSWVFEFKHKIYNWLREAERESAMLARRSNQSGKCRSSRSSKNSYSSSYSEKSRSIKAREIEEKAKTAEIQAKIQFLEQRQRAENQAEALKVHEEMAGAEARMEVYKSHNEVNAEEGSIPPPIKEETLEFGRQLRKDGKYNENEVVRHAEKNSCSRLPRLSNRRDDLETEEYSSHGLDLTNEITGVLIRFKREPIAIMADIESMFYQVRVPEKHQNFLRFLWWQNNNLDCEPSDHQMRVHVFGRTSAPSHCNFVESKEVAIKLVKNVTGMYQKEGFKLTKFISNSREVLTTIPEERHHQNIKDQDLNIGDLPVERALGVHWNIENDYLGFKINLKDKPLTRRGMLSTISSVYDPLGIAAPFVLERRKILQKLCQLKVGWDEKIPDNLKKDWVCWRNKLPKL